MRVDIGATSAEEVFAAGIDAGDRVTFDTPFQTLPHNRVMGKAFDDRLGCYLLIALLRELHQTPLDCELWLVASSSEEVGLRGGQTATRAIHPDIALVLDTACWSKISIMAAPTIARSVRARCWCCTTKRSSPQPN